MLRCFILLGFILLSSRVSGLWVRGCVTPILRVGADVIVIGIGIAYIVCFVCGILRFLYFYLLYQFIIYSCLLLKIQYVLTNYVQNIS